MMTKVVLPAVILLADQGHFPLEGVVAKQMDKQVTETQAKSVPSVFSVTNNLHVQK